MTKRKRPDNVERNKSLKQRQAVSIARTGQIMSVGQKEKIGETLKKYYTVNKHPMQDSRHNEKQKAANKSKKGTHWGKHTEITRRIDSEAHLGEKNGMWKGGLTKINEGIRHGIEFRLWREAVFARDNWICRKCNKRGKKLHPHHIKPFATYPELRFAIDNGLTLCEDCHRSTETYGIRKSKQSKLA